MRLPSIGQIGPTSSPQDDGVRPRRYSFATCSATQWPPAVAADGLVEVSIEGDEHLDVIRDVIARLDLPLYRLSTRLTSLDEVFLRQAGVR